MHQQVGKYRPLRPARQCVRNSTTPTRTRKTSLSANPATNADTGYAARPATHSHMPAIGTANQPQSQYYYDCFFHGASFVITHSQQLIQYIG